MSTTALNAADRARAVARRGLAWRGAPWAVLAVLCAALVVIALRAARGTTFFGDEWAFINDRQGFSPRTFLEPHGQHPVAIPIAYYKLWQALFGLTSYTPYVVGLIALHLATCVLLYLYARPRVGPWLALVPAALLIFLGAAWEDVIWAFQVTIVGSVTFGLAMLLALDARRYALACAALVGSLLCSGLGAPFLAAAAVEIFLQRRVRELWWVVAIPVALMAVIFLGFPSPLGIPRSAPSHAIRFAIDMGAAGFGSFGGLGLGWGRPLAVAAVVALVWAARRPGGLTPRTVALLVAAAIYWLLTGSSRADFGVAPDTARYLYMSAVLILALAVTVPPRPLLGAWGALVVGGATALLCVSGAGLFKEGGATHLYNTSVLLPKLTALEVARGHVAPNLQPDPQTNPDLTAGGYYRARDKYGTPALSVDQLRREPDIRRQYFDTQLVIAEGLKLVPGGRASGSCQNGPQATLTPGRSYVLTAAAPAALQLRRLGADYTASTMSLTGTATLALPPDRLAAPWHLKAAEPVRVCEAA